MHHVLVSVLLGLACHAAARVNYCSSRMCGRTNAHTFCLYPEGPGPDCQGRIPAELADTEKARVLARLNQRRSAAARGRLRGWPSAGNMLKLRWVEELAREAQRWADQCRPPRIPEEHDLCRDLYSTSVGQCVASVVGEAPGLRPESLVDVWYMQSRHYTANVTAFEAPAHPTGYFGDFAQMIWANTYLVGCARSRFMTPWHSRLRSVERLVCNFAPRGPVPGRALWTSAAPGAMCPPRALPDSDLPALCTFQHDLDVSHDIDNSMSLEQLTLLHTVLEVERNESLDYLGSLDELYLTKMAIVTLGNLEPTVPSNSVQKRDIDNDNIGEVDDTNKLDNVSISDGKNENKTTNDTIISKNEATLMNPTETLIGRPKPYNLDELSDVNADQIFQSNIKNHLDVIAPAEKQYKDKDLYADYEFTDILEETISTTSQRELIQDTETASNRIENATTETCESENTTEFVTNASKFSLREIISLGLLNVTNTVNDYKDIKIEDYLSDPETVRQIQQELERMENTLSTPMTTPGKARREVQEFRKDSIDEETIRQRNQQRDAANFNKTVDVPMLNLVMKYMPYLREYQTNMLKSRSSVVSPSVTLLVLTFGCCKKGS